MVSFFNIKQGIYLVAYCTLFYHLSVNAAEEKQQIQFGFERGFYKQAIVLKLTSELNNAQIVYTLDGSLPTINNGNTYVYPIPIKTTSILRAFTYNASDTSEVVSHTYIYPTQVVQQTAQTYPEKWHGIDDANNPISVAAYYGMNNNAIAADSLYEAQVVAALQNIPSLSVIMDKEELFGEETGIYNHAIQSGVNWERAASIELIYPNDTSRGFQENAGIRIAGNKSRYRNWTPKNSFRLKFKTKYGAKKLNYPLFGDTACNEFDELVLRAGFNDSWLFPNWWMYGMREKTQYLRNTFASETHLAMGHVATHHLYVHLYLNGIYWGVYNIMERPSSSFQAHYFRGNKVNYDVIKFGDLQSGMVHAWNHLFDLLDKDLSVAANYEAVTKLLDMDNFIDYMILNQYLGNEDWDHGNWYAARKQAAGEKFRFFSWDAEVVLQDLNVNVMDACCESYKMKGYKQESGWVKDMTYYYVKMQCYFEAPKRGTEIFRKLRNNEEFKMHYADRIYHHFYNNGALSSAASVKRYQQLAKEVKVALIAESARWGTYRSTIEQGHLTQQTMTLDHHWLPEYEHIVTEYLPKRSNKMLQQFKAANLFSAVAAPRIAQPVKTAVNKNAWPRSSACSLINSNLGGQIYYTLDGSDPRRVGGTLNKNAKVYEDTLFLGGIHHLKARVLLDGVWSPLAAQTFYPQQPIHQLQINEIMYHPEEVEEQGNTSKLEFIELLNNSDVCLELYGMELRKGVFYKFPWGSSVEAGEVIVLARNAAAFNKHYGFMPLGEYEGKLSNKGEIIYLQAANGELIDKVSYQSTAPWPELAGGGGYSLVLNKQEEGDRSIFKWSASSQKGGSPARR